MNVTPLAELRVTKCKRLVYERCYWGKQRWHRIAVYYRMTARHEWTCVGRINVTPADLAAIASLAKGGAR